MRRWVALTGLALLPALAAGFQCQDSSSTGEKNDAISQSREDRVEGGTDAVRFTTLRYIDQSGTGIEAFSMLVPAGWEFRGGITWVLDNPGMPATAAFTVRNPAGSEEFEVFPNQAFFWTDDGMMRSLFPVGSRYFGSEVRPPAGPLDALREIALPRFRQGAEGLRVVSQETLPELARALGAQAQSAPGLTISAEAAKIRIEYSRSGIPMEEELYGVVESYSYPLQSMAGVITHTNWLLDYLFSFKARKGELDGASQVFQAIVFSFRLSPQWFGKYTQTSEYLIQNQIQQIRNVGELSRIISRTSSEISDMMMDSYTQRQAVNDRIASDFSQYIRGVDEYYNPIEERPVELPTGYENAWTNSLGEYILSEDPGYNPNIGSNQNWQRMGRK
jgi:hypothetical protein